MGTGISLDLQASLSPSVTHTRSVSRPVWTLIFNEGRAETVRDCFREAALKARYRSVWDCFSSHTSSLVDCALQISSNKGVISGALVSTRPGLIMNGGPGNNSRAHRCSLKLKRELHRFSGGVLGPSASVSQPPAWRSDPRQPQDWSTVTHKSEAEETYGIYTSL